MEFSAIPCCEESLVHADAVEQVRSQLPPDEQLYDLAELFKIFGDSTLVKFRREGKTVYYSLADGHVIHILAQGMEHVLE